jgi:hypothetical protein
MRDRPRRWPTSSKRGRAGGRGELERDARIVTEPTQLRVHRAMGSSGPRSRRGVAAHGSRVDLGVDAIAGMGPVLAGIPALRALNARPHPARPRQPARVADSGGIEPPSYPDRCVLRRAADGSRRDGGERRAELRELLALAPVGGEVRMGWCASRSRSTRTPRS